MTDSKAIATVSPLRQALTDLQADPNSAVRLDAYRAATEIQRARLVREAATQLASTQWGGNLSQVAAVAVARWALHAGLDPLRHIYILGGKVYDNAELYLDKVASLSDFDHPEIELIAPLDRRDLQLITDDKLRQKLLVEQSALNARRLRLQMEHAVPANINDFADTAAAAKVTLFFKGGRRATGVNWAGSMGRKRTNTRDGQKRESPMDPVGDQSPVKTAITRAFRKAAKQVVPLWFKAGDAGDELAAVEEVISEGRRLEKASEPDQPRPPVAAPDDPYEPTDDDVRAEERRALEQEG